MPIVGPGQLEGCDRFVVVLTWPKKDPRGNVFPDLQAKEKLSLWYRSIPEIFNTNNFNLSGERTFLITGWTKSDLLEKFIARVKADAPFMNVESYFEGAGEMEPLQDFDNKPASGYRFIAKLAWDSEEDQPAKKIIKRRIEKAAKGGFEGIDKEIKCDLLKGKGGQNFAWIVGFTKNPWSLQYFISSIVFNSCIECKVSHGIPGPNFSKMDLTEYGQINA